MNLVRSSLKGKATGGAEWWVWRDLPGAIWKDLIPFVLDCVGRPKEDVSGLIPTNKPQNNRMSMPRAAASCLLLFFLLPAPIYLCTTQVNVSRSSEQVIQVQQDRNRMQENTISKRGVATLPCRFSISLCAQNIVSLKNHCQAGNPLCRYIETLW